MTTSPDTLERIVAELREVAASGWTMSSRSCSRLADRLEKLSAASVQVIEAATALDNGNCHLIWDHGVQRIVVELPLFNNLRAALDALEALRLSPQGEDHGR